MGISLTTGPREPSSAVDAYGIVTSPGAGQTIVTTPALPAGEYSVLVITHPTGTLASPADYDNVQLMVNAVVQGTVLQVTNAGQVTQNPPVTVRVPANGTISVQAIAAGTVGAIYKIQVIANLVGP